MSVEKFLSKKAGAVVAVALCSTLAFGAVPAEALTASTAAAAAPSSSKGKIGPVRNLQASASKSGTAYRVDASWEVLETAVAYQVTLTSPTGAVVDSGKVTEGSWHGTTALAATTRLTVKVVPLTARNRRGKAATTSVVLPDVTAPVATFDVESSGDVGTVILKTLSDDVTPAADVVRQINWGAGLVDWASDSSSFEFSAEGIYHPVVRLADAAGNVRTYTLTVVIGDETAPEGQFVTTPSSGWAKYTRVTVTQVGLHDDFSADADIERWISWGDGTAPALWQSGGSVAHVFRAAGTYTPVVTLVDQADNRAEVPTSEVSVAADTVAPVVKVTVPRTKVRRVDTWRTVRGTVTDVDGVGAARVKFRAVQKRAGMWYAYRAPSGRWVKAGTTRAAALKKTRPATVTPTANSAWSYQFKRLRKGILVIGVNGIDRVGNRSARVFVRQKLTR